MGKALVIAEKPSVAGDIARALGGFSKQKDYFESDDFIVSSAVGHLVEIKPPLGYTTHVFVYIKLSSQTKETLSYLEWCRRL